MGLRLLLLAAVTAALALGLTASASAKRTVPRNFFGAVFDGYAPTASPEAQSRHFSLMAKSGVESARVTFPWTAIEPTKNRFDFDRTDRTVTAAASHRVEVLPVLLYTPYWARVNKHNAYSPPKHNAYFDTLLKKLIQRYGPKGSFWTAHPELPKRPIRNWQIWNEPNNDIERYWDAPRGSRYAWPGGYARLLRSANKAIKKYDPKAKTVLAGITGTAWLELRRLYKFKVRNSFDIAALQVYPETVSREIESIKRLRQDLVRAKDSDVRIWVTEVAFPAAKGKTEAINRQKQQTAGGMAGGVTGLYTRLARGGRSLAVDRVYWFTWASRYGRNKSAFDFIGLVASSDGEEIKPEPALAAYRRSARRFQGCVKTVFGLCE
ncbi:MAG: beta-galactosidase [Thermoleophilaceae bacterium]